MFLRLYTPQTAFIHARNSVAFSRERSQFLSLTLSRCYRCFYVLCASALLWTKARMQEREQDCRPLWTTALEIYVNEFSSHWLSLIFFRAKQLYQSIMIILLLLIRCRNHTEWMKKPNIKINKHSSLSLSLSLSLCICPPVEIQAICCAVSIESESIIWLALLNRSRSFVHSLTLKSQ